MTSAACIVQGMTAVYLVTYVTGHHLWRFSLPAIHIPSGRLFEIIMHGKLHIA